MKIATMLILLTCSIVANLHAQNIDCAQFKYGKYLHVQDGIVIGEFTRKGDVQIERYGKVKVVLSVNWISECEYELRGKGGNHAWQKMAQNVPNEQVIRVTITSTTKNGYWIEAYIVGEKKIDSGQLHFVKADKGT